MEGLIADQMAETRINFNPKNSQKMTRYMVKNVMDDNDVTAMDYSIKTIGLEHKSKVLTFLKRFFFRDEPLNHSIGLISEGENSCFPLEDYSMSSLDENLSLAAISSTGDIVGVQLNGVMVPPEPDDEPDFIKNCPSSKFRKILKLLHYVDRKADLVNRYPNKKVIDIKIISIDNNWRGRGIASALTLKTIEMAKELDYDVIRMDCSSHFSAKLCKRLEFDLIYELKYSDFLDENKKPIFTPLFPHTAISTYVKEL